MSQIAMIASPGTVKPDIETLTGDVGGAVGPDGALNVNLLTDDFLTTTGNPGTNTITISLDNSQVDTGQTIGAVTDDICVLNLGATPATYTIEAKVAGFESTTPASAGYDLLCVARTTGAAASLVGFPDKFNREEAALAASTADFVAVGNTIVIRVTGTAGLTINWRATISYVTV